MGCHKYDKDTWICTSSGKYVESVPDKIRWCFNCRKRVKYNYQLWQDDNPWYGFREDLNCEECGKEACWFPGCEPERRDL